MQIGREDTDKNSNSNDWFSEFLPSDWQVESQATAAHSTVSDSTSKTELPTQVTSSEANKNKRSADSSDETIIENDDELFDAELADAFASMNKVELMPLAIPTTYTPLLQQGLKNLHTFLRQLSPTNNLGLRPHQQTALIEICNGLIEQKRRALIDFPTGTGKTIIFKTLIDAMFADIKPRPEILIATSRIEVCKQIREVVGSTHSVEIVTFQKLKMQLNKILKSENRYGQMVPFYQAFDLVVFDEAHNCLAEQGVKLGQQVQEALQVNGGLWYCFTATPGFNLRKASGYQDVTQLMNLAPGTNPVTPYSLAAAISDGALAPVRTAVLTPQLDQQTIQSLNTQEVVNSSGEISEEKVRRIIDRPIFNQLVAQVYANGQAPNGERFLGSQGIVFCQGTLHADHVAEELNTCLPIESHPVFMQLREAYVRTMVAKAQTKGERYSEDNFRRQFKIAQAIHSQPRLYSLPNSDMRKAFQQGGYQVAGEKYYKFSDEEKNSLDNAIKKGLPWQFYLPPLTPEQREEIRIGFLQGRYLLLPGADILTEGSDFPKARFIFNLRATKSQVTKVQTCGRGLRIDPSNPNKIAYIIDVNWGIRGQLFFYEFLGNKMSLGKMPEVNLPNQPIATIALPTTAISELRWEPKGVQLGGQTIKRRRTEKSKGNGSTMVSADEFERSMQRTEEKLQAFIGMIKRYSSVLNELGGTVKVVPTQNTIKPGEIQQAKRAKTATARSGSKEGIIADRPMAFTRGTKERMQVLTEQMKTGIEELQEFIERIKTLTDKVEKYPIKKTHSGNGGIGEDLEHHTSRREAPVDQVITKLKATSDQFSRLIAQVTTQMKDGIAPCSVSSSSGGSVKELTPVEVEQQVLQLEAQLKAIEESNELQKVVENIKKTQAQKQAEQMLAQQRQLAEQQLLAEKQRQAEQQQQLARQRLAEQQQPSDIRQETKIDEKEATEIAQSQPMYLPKPIKEKVFTNYEAIKAWESYGISLRSIDLFLENKAFPHLKVWRDVIKTCWQSLKVLINKGVIHPCQLAVLDPKVEPHSQLNLFNILQCSKYNGETLTNLFQAGYSFEELYHCRKTENVQWLLAYGRTIFCKTNRKYSNQHLNKEILLSADNDIVHTILILIKDALALNLITDRLLIEEVLSKVFNYLKNSNDNLPILLSKLIKTENIDISSKFLTVLTKVACQYDAKISDRIFEAITSLNITNYQLFVDIIKQACWHGSKVRNAYQIYQKACQTGQVNDLIHRTMMQGADGIKHYALIKSIYETANGLGPATYELMINIAIQNKDQHYAIEVFNKAVRLNAVTSGAYKELIRFFSNYAGNVAFYLINKLPKSIGDNRFFKDLIDALVYDNNLTVANYIFTKATRLNWSTFSGLLLHINLQDESSGTTYLGLKQILTSNEPPSTITLKYNSEQISSIKKIWMELYQQDCKLPYTNNGEITLNCPRIPSSVPSLSDIPISNPPLSVTLAAHLNRLGFFANPQATATAQHGSSLALPMTTNNLPFLPAFANASNSQQTQMPTGANDTSRYFQSLMTAVNTTMPTATAAQANDQQPTSSMQLPDISETEFEDFWELTSK